MAELVIVHIVEVRQLRQRGPLLHQVPTARRPANRLQDVLGGEGWEIHALGSGQRDGFTCPSHVLGPHSGHRLHPAFRIRRPGPPVPPGSPVPPGRRVSHLRQNDRTYIYAFPDWEYVSAHASKASAYSVVSPLRGFAPCNAAQRRYHLRRMSMHRTRDRALRREASRTDNLLDLAAPVLKG